MQDTDVREDDPLESCTPELHVLPLKTNALNWESATQNVLDTQETELTGLSPTGMLATLDHLLPSNSEACPLSFASRQNEADTQDSPAGSVEPSTRLGELKEVPLKVNALPSKSPIAQKVVDAHETVLRSPTPSLAAAGPVHEVPLHVSAIPFWSTARQELADTQDTRSAPPPRAVGGEFQSPS